MRGSDGRAVVRMGVLALLWGSTFLWIKVALDGLSPAQLTFTRCALGAGLLLVLCMHAKVGLPRGWAVWGRITIAALLCNALPFTLFSIGQQRLDSGLAGVLNATTPLWALLLGIGLGTERNVPAMRLAGLVTGFAGTLLIFAPWQRTGLASWHALALLGAALSYALAFTYMGRKLVGTGMNSLSIAAAQLVMATVLSTPAVLATGLDTPHLTVRTASAILVLGTFCTGITFYLTVRIIASEGATDAAVVGYLLPVVSVALGAVILNETVGVRLIAGMLVVLVGVALTRWRRHSPSATVATTIRSESRQP